MAAATPASAEPVARGKGLAGFLLWVLAAGALLYPAWYLAAPWLARPVVAVARVAAESMGPMESLRPTLEANELVFIAKPSAQTLVSSPQVPVGIAVEIRVDVLKYTYGLPFFIALLLAARTRGLAWKLAAGSAIVLLCAAFGIACDIWVHAFSAEAPGGARLFPLGAFATEAIALGYQLGVLIFPTVVPVLLWGAFAREKLAILRA